MAKYFAIVVAIMVCMASVAESAASCDSVYNKLSPCQSALKKGGSVTTKCCDGVRSLNSGATTTAARKSVCECAKKLANAYKVKSETATGVLNKCKVDVGFPISNNVDCSRVK